MMNTNRNTIVAAVATGLVALTAGTLIGGAGGFVAGRTTAPTPEACLIALDEGERTLAATADGLELAGEAVVAAAEWDYVTLERITAELNVITTDIGEPDLYLDSAAECRGEAK